MKKTGSIFTILLVIMFIASTAIVIARNQSNNDLSSGSNELDDIPIDGISLMPNGETSVQFDEIGDFKVFEMKIKNNGGYDIKVTLYTQFGGMTEYFKYNIGRKEVYTIGPFETKTISFRVKAIAQSPDTEVPMSFKVTAESGNYGSGTLTFTASILPGEGNQPTSYRQQIMQIITELISGGNTNNI